MTKIKVITLHLKKILQLENRKYKNKIKILLKTKIVSQ